MKRKTVLSEKEAGLRSLGIGGLIFVLLSLIPLAIFHFVEGFDAVGLFISVCIALAAAVSVGMAVFFRYSMRRTLYSYTNIGLVGGILFLLVLIAVMTASLVECIASGDVTLSHVFGQLVGFPREFSFYAVFVLVAICILLGISNIALIRHEGFRPKNALSILLAVFYLGGTAAIYLISDLLKKNVFIPKGYSSDSVFVALGTVIPLFLIIMLCYFECILAGSAVMGFLAARAKPDHDRDFIIILGCSIDKRGGLLPLLKGRVNRAVRFAWEQEIDSGKPLLYVPSGGKGENEVMSEGSAMELYLLTHGAEDYEVFPERESKNTFENLLFSKRIIDKINPDAKIAFATTNYHILRAGILARNAGFDAQGIAGDTKWYFWPNGFIREFFGILAMKKKAHLSVALFSFILCAAVAVAGCVFGLF